MGQEFMYPDVLNKSDEMYKNAKRISHDDAIFGARKALLEKHFEEYPIYLDDSYYAQSSRLPRVVRKDGDFAEAVNLMGWKNLSSWRDCHYYSLFEWEGHRFFIMTGGRYD